jgi:hypothetical protein
LRSECAQNYKERHFLRQTGFDIAGKTPGVASAKRDMASDPKVAEYANGAAAIERFVHRTLISIGARYGLRPFIHSRLVFCVGSGS